MMDDRVYNESELRRLLPVAVISELPVIDGPINEKGDQKRLWLGWATATVVFVVILGGIRV